MPPDKFRALADEIATGAFIRGDEFNRVCAGGIKAMVEAATTGGDLKDEDRTHIAALVETFGIDLHALEDAGARLVKAAVWRDLRGGKLPADIRLDGPAVLSLQCNECVVWVFISVAWYSVARSDRAATHRQQVGRSVLTMRMNGFKSGHGRPRE